MRFTLRQIEYFVATAESGSITQASEKLRISQPSISTAITHLEQELEVQLFLRRHAQGLTLTPEGRVLLAEAKRLIKQAGSLYSVASDTSDRLRGKLSLGCLVTFASMVLPQLMQGFKQAHPATAIQSIVSDHEDLLERVQNAELDAALSYDLLVPEAFDFMPLAALPPHLVISASHPLARRATVALEELVEEPMILLDLPISRDYFLGLFAKRGLNPTVDYSSTHPDVIRTMVANGCGYTLANVRPRTSVAMDGGEVRRVPLEGRHKAMVMGLVSLRQDRRSRLVEAFKSHCAEMITDASIPGMDSTVRGDSGLLSRVEVSSI